MRRLTSLLRKGTDGGVVVAGGGVTTDVDGAAAADGAELTAARKRAGARRWLRTVAWWRAAWGAPSAADGGAVVGGRGRGGVAADVDGLAATDGRPGQWRTDWWRQHGSGGDFGKKIAKHFGLGKRSGLRADFGKVRGIFWKKNIRGGLDCGLIRLKFEGCFAKRPQLARSGPSARPIERPRKAGDVARWLASFWRQDSYGKMGSATRTPATCVASCKFLEPCSIDFLK